MATFVLQYVSHAVVSLPALFILESLVRLKDNMKTLHHLRENGILNPLINTSSLLAKLITDPDPTTADEKHRSTHCCGELQWMSLRPLHILFGNMRTCLLDLSAQMWQTFHHKRSSGVLPFASSASHHEEPRRCGGVR